MALTASMVLADSVMVEVCQYALCEGGEPQLIDEAFCEAGETYQTLPAPTINGHIFTHWDIAPIDPLVSRDFWSRALDEAVFIPYQDVALTAHYVPESQDSDGDGIADGWELYWYGSLEKSSDSDTDHDGFTFAEELANGTNPHFADAHQHGRIKKCLSGFIQINPYNSSGFIIRADDGSLLEETTNYVVVGGMATTPALSPTTSAFAYWTVNGVPARDAFGRALDHVSVPMPEGDLVIEARTEADEAQRLKLYWYGTTDVEMDSDTDGDGYSFAEELANGTNPHLPESRAVGRIRKALGEKVLLNPFGFAGYIVRSEGGDLVQAETNYVAIGNAIVSPTFSPDSSTFAYWRVNGEAVRDAFGRAKDRVEMSMPEAVLELVAVSEANAQSRQKLYWYGTTDVEMDSDTDGDGYTFAEELANGTNPHFPDSRQDGAVKKAAGALVDVNGQIYEKVSGIVLDGEYIRIFDSDGNSQAGTDVIFTDQGGNPIAVWPIACDINGDGLFDVVICSESWQRIFINVGGVGNPAFREDASGALGERVLPWITMNSPEKLAGLTLDVPAPGDALSATTNGTALLVSDSEGRIWYYKGTQATEATEGTSPTSQSLSSLSFTLQHKVWGGSHAGFAQGLRLAAVDWDDDGDLDCLAGTADGKLMLLRDPKVGRPTNLKALAGVDNVLLTWDPNQQSRIRGYRVYRALPEQAGESSAGTRIAQTPLPTYRDFPGSGDEFAYKVSSVSRFYTAGNSTPTETESMPTEAVTAQIGSVRFFWNDASTKVGEQVAVMLSIENSMNYNVAGKTEVVAYDPEYLMPVKVVKTGLTEECVIEESHHEKAGASPAGEWQVTITGAVGGGTPTLPAGGGKFLMFVFEAKKEGVTTVGGATVSIAAGSVIVPYQLGDLDGDGDVDVEDLRLLAQLKNGNGRKYTANQLKAGDFNGNGKLDNADYQALREMLKEQGAL